MGTMYSQRDLNHFHIKIRTEIEIYKEQTQICKIDFDLSFSVLISNHMKSMFLKHKRAIIFLGVVFSTDMGCEFILTQVFINHVAFIDRKGSYFFDELFSLQTSRSTQQFNSYTPVRCRSSGQRLLVRETLKVVIAWFLKGCCLV